MENKIRINIIGRESGGISVLETLLKTQPRFNVKINFEVEDCNVKNIYKFNENDIIILSLTDNWETTLDSIQGHFKTISNPLIVIGPENTKAMRQSMKLGANDYFTHPVNAEELNAALDETVSELEKNPPKSEVAATPRQSMVTTVINTAGGSGASFIAANISHLFADAHKQRVSLIDMDLQFGSQALNLDMQLHHGLTEVLANVGKIDTVALQGFFSKHKSGLHVLGEKLDDIVIPGEISSDDIEKLMDLCSKAFDHTVIDLPRQIDPIFASVIAKSNRIVLVMQQTLAHVRDTKRMLTILLNEFHIPKEHITVIINRYDEEHSITLKDIESTINHKPLVLLPNDYKRAVQATDVAKPFVEFAPNTQLAKALIDIAEELLGTPLASSSEKTDGTFFKKAFKKVLGG